MKFELTKIPEPAAALFALAEKHVDRSTSLEELIFTWISEERSILCLGGTNDETGRPACFLLLEYHDLALGHVEIDLEVLRALHPDVPLATEMSGEENWGSEIWNEVLCEDTIASADAVKFCISYLLTNQAEVRISIDQGDSWHEAVETDEKRILDGKELVLFAPFFQNHETNKGFGEFRSVLRPKVLDRLSAIKAEMSPPAGAVAAIGF